MRKRNTVRISPKRTDKPCPICYSLMRKVTGGWDCPRHGFIVVGK